MKDLLTSINQGKIAIFVAGSPKQKLKKLIRTVVEV